MHTYMSRYHIYLHIYTFTYIYGMPTVHRTDSPSARLSTPFPHR